MRIAIVDDNLLFAKSFRNRFINTYGNTIAALDIFTTAERFLESNLKYDVVFLDIDMPTMSGLELAKQYKDKVLNIVFVTNRDDLVFEAYNTTNTLGFIRKSNIEEDLPIVLDRLYRESQNTMYLTIKSGTNLVRIRYSEILYVEKMSHNVILHTLTDSLSMRKTITETEELLKGYGFVRTHIGYIVNLEYIKYISSKDVILTNLKTVPISRHNIKLIKDAFLKWSVKTNE